MAIRDIVKDGESILRKKAREVTAFDKKLACILEDMKETMEQNGGVGLAAPQIGFMRRFAICLLEDEKIVEIINPVVLESSGEEIMEEGCLSVPDKHCNVARPTYVKLQYQDRKGKTKIKEFFDFDARVCSHELDHLDGILFYDRKVDVE